MSLSAVSSAKLVIDTPRVFRPLLEPKRYKAAYGGRGSGKSHFFAELLVEDSLRIPGLRSACLREVQKSLKDSAKLLIEDKIKALGVGKYFEPQVDRIVAPGGGVIVFQGLQDHTAESIKSLEGFKRAWVEEAQTISARSWELLRPTIRAEESEIWASWNPRNAWDPVDAFFRGPEPPKDAIVVRANYSDNPFFPSVLEGERQHDQKTNPARYAHIWLGEYEPMAIGAIWDRANFHQHRMSDMPPLERIVVAVDPAVSSEPGSDEHGIIVAGIGSDQRGYLLADYSTKGPPRHWATRAIAAYDRFDADCIVIERNQGGDMCRHTIESVRQDVRIVEVVATRGKHVRAEPISALYALGRVSHVGTYPELEDQMCKMTAGGYEGDGSPDRTDALVWAFTELFPQITTAPNKPVKIDQYQGSGSWMA